ncbi:acetyltransferase [Nemania serpens]|nr:acetyltransferase [Nemania serpens]
MSTTPTFQIRGLDEGPEDGQFMIDSFDASLVQLATIGSGGQWGSEPFSARSNAGDRIKIFEQAKRYQTTGEGDPIRLFIAEVEIPASTATTTDLPESARIRTGDGGEKFLAVGYVMLSEGICPPYMRLQFDKDAIKKELDGTRDYIYLEALITDFRTGPWRKGAGAALIEHARRFCRERGKSIIYLDSYAGNDRKLVRYYEKQGCTVVDDFAGLNTNGVMWHGTFYRMDVTEYRGYLQL